MRIGVTLEDEKGLEGNVSAHFGQCAYFLIADAENGHLQHSKVVANEAQHGGGGCQAVSEILKHKVTHVISGGMGMGAQQKFAQAGVEVFGASGKVKDALDHLMKNALGGLGACREHGHGGGCH